MAIRCPRFDDVPKWRSKLDIKGRNVIGCGANRARIPPSENLGAAFKVKAPFGF